MSRRFFNENAEYLLSESPKEIDLVKARQKFVKLGVYLRYIDEQLEELKKAEKTAAKVESLHSASKKGGTLVSYTLKLMQQIDDRAGSCRINLAIFKGVLKKLIKFHKQLRRLIQETRAGGGDGAPEAIKELTRIQKLIAQRADDLAEQIRAASKALDLLRKTAANLPW